MEAMKYTPSSITANNIPASILAVDDDPEMLILLQAYLEKLGHKVLTARNGKEALDILHREKANLDIILLDQVMPEMQGLEVVGIIKQDPGLKNIPVIMQTASNRPQDIKKGIDSGVYYYLTKPINGAVLNSVLSAAIRDIRQKRILNAEIKKHKISFSLMQNCSFRFNTLAEAEGLACFIAKFYPDPEKTVTGLAELLLNAVEHGNLEIGFNEKTALLNNNSWRDEVLRREKLPEYKDRYVDVSFQRKGDGIYISISDQGKGFEWHKYMQVDPARAQDNHGRGIAQANAMSFDRITYNEKGNEVTAFSGFDSDIDW